MTGAYMESVITADALLNRRKPCAILPGNPRVLATNCCGKVCGMQDVGHYGVWAALLANGGRAKGWQRRSLSGRAGFTRQIRLPDTHSAAPHL